MRSEELGVILFADQSKILDLRKLICKKNIYACKIACLLDSYGLKYDFAEFWLQYENNEPVTAISKFYGDMTVCTTEKTDFDELKEFLLITGFSSVISEKEIFYGSYKGIVMEKVAESQDITVEINPDLNEVYRLLESCKSNNFEVPEYEDFILDMSHKIRHKTALCVGVREDEKLISTAMTVAQSETCAIIGAVSTDENYRHSGYGGKCVKTLCGLMNGRKIFIMRDEFENENFYKSMGFENKGKFYISKGEGKYDTVL